MPGFPPIDRLYYDNPPPMRGSWMLIRLRQEAFYSALRPHHQTRTPKDLFDLCFGFALDESSARALDPRFPELARQTFHQNPMIELDPTRTQSLHSSEFQSLAELRAFLLEQHSPAFRYRGQTRRYQTIYQGHVPGLASWGHLSGPVTIKFEGLVPSLFRSVIRSKPADWDNYAYPSKLGQLAPALRAILRSQHEPLRSLVRAYFRDVLDFPEIFARYALTGRWNLILPEQTLGRFAPGTTTPNTLLRLISVAQHYGFGSVMVDITQAVDVAVWFATHHFASGEIAQGDQDARGVIYRFNAAAIQTATPAAIESGPRDPGAFPVAGLMRAAGFVGMTDIADLDPTYGNRPKAQVGGSILGLENSTTYLQHDLRAVLEVFTFPLSTITGRETSFDKESLCPSDDPSAKVLDPASSPEAGEIRDDELGTFLTSEHFSKDEIDRVLTLHQEGAI